MLPEEAVQQVQHQQQLFVTNKPVTQPVTEAVTEAVTDGTSVSTEAATEAATGGTEGTAAEQVGNVGHCSTISTFQVFPALTNTTDTPAPAPAANKTVTSLPPAGSTPASSTVPDGSTTAAKVAPENATTSALAASEVSTNVTAFGAENFSAASETPEMVTATASENVTSTILGPAENFTSASLTDNVTLSVTPAVPAGGAGNVTEVAVVNVTVSRVNNISSSTEAPSNYSSEEFNKTSVDPTESSEIFNATTASMNESMHRGPSENNTKLTTLLTTRESFTTAAHVSATNTSAIKAEEKSGSGSYGYTSEVVLICLVVVFGLAFFGMAVKYWQLRKNIGDYRIQQVQDCLIIWSSLSLGQCSDLRQPGLQRVWYARQLSVLQMTGGLHPPEANLPLSSSDDTWMNIF